MNEARAITAGFAGVCGLAFVGSVIPGVNDFLDTWVFRVGGLAVLGFAVWFGVGELRDWLFYREAARPLVRLQPEPVEPEPAVEPEPVDALDDGSVD